MVAAANHKPVATSDTAPSTSSTTTDVATTTPDMPPVIQLKGNNTATVQVGTTYNDLGATITGPQADLTLGIHTFVNGAASEPVQIDTSAAATDTIDYVVTIKTV